MKKILSALICLMMIGQCAIFVSAASFTDVPATAYFYEAVKWAVAEGITAGKTETTFAPNETCTRAQAVSFIWRAKGCPEPAGTQNPFTDVKESHYFYKAVLWAVENGINAGMTPTTFGPNQNCTRGQIVTFLWNTEGKPIVSAENPFTDVKESHYFYNAVLWAVENNITAGMSETKFAPNNKCTRGQIVCFLERCYKNVLEIVTQPEDFYMEFSEADATFTVEIAGGKPGYYYDWYVEGEKKATHGATDATSDSFTYHVTDYDFDNVQGSYLDVVCCVTDITGKQVISNTAKLFAKEVTKPLEITKQPEDVLMEYVEGDAEFTVEIEGGRGGYIYEWYVEGEKMGTYSSSYTTDSFSYYVNSHTFDDVKGNCLVVICRVTDAEGTTVSTNTAKLYKADVVIAPLTIKSQPKNYQMTSSMEEAKFSIVVEGGAGAYLYEWSVVMDGEVKQVIEKDVTSNTIDNLYYEFSDYDFDIYRDIEVFCVVTDKEGNKVTSDIAVLYSKSSASPLAIKTQPVNYQMSSSMEMATFTVEVDGGARSYLYEWSIVRDGTVFKTFSYGVTSDSSNTFSYEFSDYDFDYYRDIEVFCVITDAKGDNVTTNTVAVLQK